MYSHLETAILVAVFSAVFYTLFSRNLSDRYTPFERSYVMLGVGAVIFTGLAVFQTHGSMAEYLLPMRTASYRVSVAFLSVCCSVICYFLSCYMLTYISIARATVFANLTTAVSVIAGVLVLHEPFSPAGLACCILILLGIYGVQKTARKETV